MTRRSDPSSLRRRGGGLFLPLYALRVAPQAVEVVEHPRFLVEHVEDDVDEVDEHPLIAVGAALAERAVISGLTELAGVVADGLHLPRAGAGGEDEVIGDGRNAADVEDDDVMAAGVGCETGDVNRKLAGGLRPLLSRVGRQGSC